MADQPPAGVLPILNRPRPVKGHVLFDILTRATYRTFTRAIKEAVSNAYDADAHHVEITFAPKKFLQLKKPAELTIQIRDDGKGMSLRDFWESFASIESKKDPAKRNPDTKRFPIGQFGIGSFALVPFSLRLSIYSKKYKEKPIKCDMDCPKLLAKGQDEYSEHVAKNIESNEIPEKEWDTIFGSGDSGTVIVIKGVTDETFAELLQGTGVMKKDEEKWLFPNAPFTVGLKEIAWELSTLLPLDYSDDPGEVYQNNQSSLASNNPGIRITLSEEELERKIYSRAGSVPSTIDYTDEKNGVHARGVIIATPRLPVQPRRANGVILRLNNVGIGEYRLFNLVGNATIRSRITGEIHILDGLHGSLNVARDNFSGPVYDKLREHLDDALVKLHKRASANWTAKGKRKSGARKKKTEQNFKRLYEQEQKKTPPPQPAPQPPPNPGGGSKPRPTATKPEPPPVTPGPHGGAKVKSQDKTEAKPQDNGDTSAQQPGPSQPGSCTDFKDPVADVQGGKGKVRFDEGHELFKVYKGKVERETIELVLCALKLASVPDDAYQRVIQHLLSLK